MPTMCMSEVARFITFFIFFKLWIPPNVRAEATVTTSPDLAV